MRRRSGFLTFLAALIPGVGYMYLGLMKKGLEALIVFLMIEPLFSMLGLGFIGNIIRFPLWFYCFFDTYNIAHKMDRGELVLDSGFILDRILNNNSKTNNTNNNYMGGNANYQNNDMNNQYDNTENYSGDIYEPDPALEKKKWIIIGWCIIGLGLFGILSKILAGSVILNVFTAGVKKYFIPIAFIIGGIALLKKNK